MVGYLTACGQDLQKNKGGAKELGCFWQERPLNTA
jgi:hypothetical protein